MTVDIKPIHGTYCNCMEDVLITLSKHWKVDYTLMFSETWGFNFLPQVKGMLSIIGKRLEASNPEYLKNWDMYHGIKSKWHFGKDLENYVTLIVNETTKGYPVAIFIDAFSVPWTDTYKKLHAPHFFIAVGIDRDNILCVDPFISTDIERLPIEDFMNGNSKCVSFSQSSDIKTVNWKEIVENAVGKVMSINGKGENSFAKMRNFAKELGEVQDLSDETRGYSISYFVPLFIQLSEIANGRFNFAKVLEHLSESSGIKEFIIFSERLRKSGFRFREVRKLLMKEVDDNEKRKMIAESVELIMLSADEEEQLAKDMMTFCG